MLVALVPFLIVAAVVRKFAPRPLDANARLLPDWPAKLLSNGVTIAILVVSAHCFLKDEMERTSSAKIYPLNLNGSDKLPEDAKFMNAIGRVEGEYLYVIEQTRSGRSKRATVYAPFTGRQWTPDQSVAYVVRLHYGYGSKPSADGKGREYSIADRDAEK